MVRGGGPPNAPAVPKQDDPVATALDSIGAVEDFKDLGNSTIGGKGRGANDNTGHQTGGRIRRR
jgi:hypothetical protein